MSETRTITTPVSQTEIVLKSWITGGDDEDIRAVAEEAATVTEDGRTSITGAVVKAMRHKALSIVVQRVGGQSDDIVERLRALPLRDYNFVVAEVDAITEGESGEKKV